jgi:hypothetical protein
VKPLPRWPLAVIAAPAAVATWSGWTGLGELCGFGPVHPLPGIWDAATVNSAITLPVGVEAYATYALAAWLRPGTPAKAKRFARWSALGSLALGAAGQVSYHLLSAWRATAAPWPVVTIVSCLPVAVLGLAGGLSHLLRTGDDAAADGVPVDAVDDAPDEAGDEADDEPAGTPRAAKPSRTFEPGGMTERRCEGECGQVRPVRSFPTVRGTTRRHVECRACRAARTGTQPHAERAA